MSLTENRIREALVERAGPARARSLPRRAVRRIRLRQASVVSAVSSAVAIVVAVAVVTSGAVSNPPPRPTSTFDPAADGFTSPLEDVPPGWPSVDIHDPATAYVPSLAGEGRVLEGPVVLASGDVEDSSFTLYAFTLAQDSTRTACLGFVGFAAPDAPTRSAPHVVTCANAPAVPDTTDVAFIGAGAGDGHLEANFGFVSGRVDGVYVWGGGKLGMFAMPTLAALDGWNVEPFFFVPARDAGPLEVDARLHGGIEELAHADICRPSDVPRTCRTNAVQDLPVGSPVDVPVPLSAGDWPAVTYSGDFEPYVDHEVNAAGVRDPGVVGEKQVVAYGTVQGAPWSQVGYNVRCPGAPGNVSPAEDFFVTNGGGSTGASLLDPTACAPNDLVVGRGHGGGENFDSIDGMVSSRVDVVRLELTDGTIRDARLFTGPDGVEAKYFVMFVPHDVSGRLVALDETGQEIEQMCLRDMMGVPPGGDPCA